jgi:AraC-like DNA-binding protein
MRSIERLAIGSKPSVQSNTARNDGLLAKHEIIRTDKSERMADALLEVYKGRLVSVDCSGQPFFGQANRAQFEHIGFDYCVYGADVEIEFPEAPSFRQQICLSGGGETIMQRKSAALSDAATCVIRPETKVTTRFGAGYSQLVMRVDPAALRRKLEAFLGTHLPNPIEFRPAQRFVTPQLQLLKRSALFFVNEIETFESEACELARSEFEQALLAAFLSGNAHNYSYLFDAPPPGLTPRQVWLAESFIEANWDSPLTVETLSKAVGVGARSIFKSFKRFRGYSPMAFLRDVRLRRAREMLRDAEPGATVTAVAYRCAYQNHGYFAREYRARFGESPSTTLARARRERPV